MMVSMILMPSMYASRKRCKDKIWLSYFQYAAKCVVWQRVVQPYRL